MNENLYGIILEPPVKAEEVLKLLKKLEQVPDIDYIMPKPGTVAVLGRDLYKIRSLFSSGVSRRVIRGSGNPEIDLNWRISDFGIEEMISFYKPCPGTLLKFTYRDIPLFSYTGSMVITENFPFGWENTLNMIHQYGFSDNDIGPNDLIWEMAGQLR